MSVLLFLALFLSLTSYSNGAGATYCICKDGAQDPTAYQKVIDYACGAGADCKAIQDNGPCYVPNNLKAICDYAVNSYFQNKGQTTEACVFSGAATPSNNLPSTVPSGCTFPTSGSSSGGGGGMGTGGGTGIYSPNGLMGPTGSMSDMNPSGSPPTYRHGTVLLLSSTLFTGLLLLLWA